MVGCEDSPTRDEEEDEPKREALDLPDEAMGEGSSMEESPYADFEEEKELVELALPVRRVELDVRCLKSPDSDVPVDGP